MSTTFLSENHSVLRTFWQNMLYRDLTHVFDAKSWHKAHFALLKIVIISRKLLFV